MAKDLFAPPTAEELKELKANAAHSNEKLYAAPTAEELKSIGKAPDEQPSSLTSDIGDFAKGVGQGATLGFGDEILGGLQAAGQKTGEGLGITKDSGKNLLELYRQYQKQNEQAYKEAKERSPYLTTGGELASGALLAAASPLGLIGEGAQAVGLGQKLLTGAKIGAIAGIGGSEGTIEGDPTSILKDAATGAGIGAAGSAALSGLGAAGKKIGALVDDSPLAKKLAATFDFVKNKGQDFTGTNAGTDLERDLSDTAGSVAKQFTSGLSDSGKMYGEALKDASDAGSKLGHDSDFINALKSAKSDVGSIGGGSDARRALELLQKHGGQSFDPLTLSTTSSSINPEEGKELQLLLRKLGGTNPYSNTGSLDAASQALTPAIDQALPEGTLSRINDTFSSARNAVEPALNKGETDKIFQGKSVSDIDPELISGKLKTTFQDLIRKSQESNTQGDQARLQLKNILDGLRNTNESSQKMFADPSQIANQINDTGLKIGIRKGIVGERSTDTIGKIGGLADFALGSPYRVAQYAGQVAKSPLVQSGQAIYQASDDGLRTVAKVLSDNGLGHIGSALTQALDNKSSAAKNAALFTIMQNPQARKTIFGDGTSDN